MRNERVHVHTYIQLVMQIYVEDYAMERNFIVRDTVFVGNGICVFEGCAEDV